MKTISDIRRANLASLVAEFGGVGKLAAHINKAQSQVSQWLNASADSKSGKPRVVSNKSARQIEAACGKRHGWIDSPHETTEGMEAEATQTPSVRIRLFDAAPSMGRATWNTRLSERLKEIGMRPADLARAVKVSTATVSDWESGAIKTIKGVNLIKVSVILGVNPDWLLSGRGQKCVGTGIQNAAYVAQPAVDRRMSSTRRELTADEKADAERLLTLWRLGFEGKVSQEEVAFRCGWKTQAAFSQYLLGRIPLNISAVLKISKALGVAPTDISPRLAADLPKYDTTRDRSNIYHLPARPDVIEVQAFDARPSMGRGAMQPEHDTVIGKVHLSMEWVRHNLSISSSNKLAILTAYGDSMAPTFADGDMLLVDRGVVDVKLDAVYVLALNDELYVKRVQRRITDGAVIIKSDNPLYDPVILDNGERNALQVLGRVVWAWNGRKL